MTLKKEVPNNKCKNSARMIIKMKEYYIFKSYNCKMQHSHV